MHTVVRTSPVPTWEGPDREGGKEGFALTVWARELRPELGRAEGQARPPPLVFCAPACPPWAEWLCVGVPGRLAESCVAGPGGPPCLLVPGPRRARGRAGVRACSRGPLCGASCPGPGGEGQVLMVPAPRGGIPHAGGAGPEMPCFLHKQPELEQFYFYFLFLLPCWLFLAAGLDRPPPSSLHLASWPRPGPS